MTPLLRDNNGDVRVGRVILAIVLIAILLASVAYLTFGSVVNVGVGYAVIVVDAPQSSIGNPIVGAKWYMFGKAPWASQQKFYIGVDKLGMWGDGTDQYADMPAVHSVSDDGLEVDIDLMIRWRLDVSKLRSLYLKYPLKNWKFDVIGSIVRKASREAVSKFGAIDIIANRSAVAQQIVSASEAALASQAQSLMESIVDLEIELRDIIPQASFLNATQAKLIAEQGMLQAEFEKETMITLAEGEKQRTIIAAEAEAERLIVEATAEAGARVLVANGTRDAINQIVSATGMTNGTQIAELYLTLEALKTIASETEEMLVFLTMTKDGLLLTYPIQP